MGNENILPANFNLSNFFRHLLSTESDKGGRRETLRNFLRYDLDLGLSMEEVFCFLTCGYDRESLERISNAEVICKVYKKFRIFFTGILYCVDYHRSKSDWCFETKISIEEFNRDWKGHPLLEDIKNMFGVAIIEYMTPSHIYDLFWDFPLFDVSSEHKDSLNLFFATVRAICYELREEIKTLEAFLKDNVYKITLK